MIKSNFKRNFHKKKINIIELLDNDKISKDYFQNNKCQRRTKFLEIQPFKLKKDLESFNEIKNFTFFKLG